MRVTNLLPTDAVAESMRGIVKRCKMWSGR
jgi:hypothetical protein